MVCSKTLDQIVAVSDLNPENDVVIEIGSGAGFLTERLVGNVKQLYSVELDQNALTALEILKANNDNFDYLRRDFLSLNITDIVAPE